ncbi:DUF1559 family PulG-like putative transporter [Roseiconus lacunae]|uniref:DUF1559 family PulG-like putative transporter n=1 Tax=Roseiconus lacunae TaxID=2605694 RepID=UPI0011F12F4B|nr:DUF1559 domain-containing protein [Roseiconus lacunae]
MRTKLSKSRQAAAFTAIELIVALAILAIVVSISLVAIQSSRAASRDVSCKNNLRQLALAVHQYEEQFGSLPASYGGVASTSPRYSGRSDGPIHASGMWRILPYLGYEQLSQLVRSLNAPTGFVLQEGGARRPDSTVLPVLHCSSDYEEGFEGTSYRFCAGSTPFSQDLPSLGRDLQPNGAFGFFERSLSAVEDGLSYSAMFSERRLGHQGAFFDGKADIIGLPLHPTLPLQELTHEMFGELADRFGETAPAEYFPISGLRWHFPGKYFVLYDHVFAPAESVSGMVSGYNTRSSDGAIGAVGASSYHRGHANSARLDGSVGSTSNEVDILVWRDFGSIY